MYDTRAMVQSLLQSAGVRMRKLVCACVCHVLALSVNCVVLPVDLGLPIPCAWIHIVCGRGCCC